MNKAFLDGGTTLEVRMHYAAQTPTCRWAIGTTTSPTYNSQHLCTMGFALHIHELNASGCCMFDMEEQRRKRLGGVCFIWNHTAEPSVLISNC
jgi:hypothetical protein